MEKRTQNCYILEKNCTEEAYGNITWRKLFPGFPQKHFFYGGFEFLTDLSSLRDAEFILTEYFKSYYTDGRIWKQKAGFRAHLDGLPFYQDKCSSCPGLNRYKNCSDIFPLVFFAEYQIKEDAFCGSNNHNFDVDCKTCKVNPQKNTKLAKDHVKSAKNRQIIEVSDLRLGGHAVKVRIQFVSYRCAHTEEAIRTLPFLYGDSIDRVRVSYRLGLAISENLLNGVGPSYVSEASAIPLGTIKKWRQRDQIISIRAGERSMAQQLLKNRCSKELPGACTLTNYVCFISAEDRSREPELSRIYTKAEWDSIRCFAENKTYHFADIQLPYPHLFLLSFDYFASEKNNDLPVIRSLLLCMKYAAETNSFDRFLDFVSECKGNDRLSDIQAIFTNGLKTSWDGCPSEFYRQLAIYKHKNGKSGNHSTHLSKNDSVDDWWKLFKEDLEVFQPSFFVPLPFEKETRDLLDEIDQLTTESEFPFDETAALLGYYNPALFISNFVSSEEVFFPRTATGGLDFRLRNPAGVSLKILQRMLQAGYLSQDNTQSIWERIEKMH